MACIPHPPRLNSPQCPCRNRFLHATGPRDLTPKTSSESEPSLTPIPKWSTSFRMPRNSPDRSNPKCSKMIRHQKELLLTTSKLDPSWDTPLHWSLITDQIPCPLLDLSDLTAPTFAAEAQLGDQCEAIAEGDLPADPRRLSSDDSDPDPPQLSDHATAATRERQAHRASENWYRRSSMKSRLPSHTDTRDRTTENPWTERKACAVPMSFESNARP